MGGGWSRPDHSSRLPDPLEPHRAPIFVWIWGWSDSRMRSCFRVVLRDLGFANVVYQQYYATWVLLFRLGELEQLAEQIIARIEAG